MHSDAALLEIARQTPYNGGKILSATVGTGDFWSHDGADIERISVKYGTACEEMETFAVAEVCAKTATPFLGIRMISNNELTHESFCEGISKRCQQYTVDVLKSIIKQEN